MSEYFIYPRILLFIVKTKIFTWKKKQFFFQPQFNARYNHVNLAIPNLSS